MSIKGILYVGSSLMIMVMVLLLGANFYSVLRATRVLHMVYDGHVVPTSALLGIDKELKEVRFRLAGYLVDQLPAVGNKNHLREARKKIAQKWGLFTSGMVRRNEMKYGYDEFDKATDTLVGQIGKNIVATQSFFDKLDKVYSLDDKEAALPLLEDEWPFVIHLGLLKPISKLVPIQEAAIEATYRQNTTEWRLMLILVTVGLTAVIFILIFYTVRLISSIIVPLSQAVNITKEIAEGDMDTPIDNISHNEIGRLLNSFDSMRSQVQGRQQRLQAVLDTAAEGIIIFEADGRIESFNLAAEQLFGCKLEEASEKQIDLFILIPAEWGCSEGFLKCFKQKKLGFFTHHEREVLGRHQSGHTFPMSINISFFKLKEQRLYTAMVSDITERKEAEDALQRANDELEMNVEERTKELTAEISERKKLEERERVRSVELKGLVKSLQNLVAELQLNVKQAKQLLGLVNGEQPRYIEAGDVTLFSHGIELSCNQEGGDHYFVHEVPGNGNGDMGKTIISLKDQSGHSVSCIHRSIMTDMFYQSLISENGNKPLEQILEALNRNMLDSKLLSDEEFFTSIDVEIDHKTLKMRYASGGHPPFIHIRGDKVSAFPEIGGDGHNPPLATFGSAGISVGELELQCGDKLLFYTDGLTEATIKHGKDAISTDDLIGIVSRYAGLPVSEIQNRVIAEVSMLSGEFIDPGENKNTSADDVTILGVEIEDREAYHEEVLQPQSSEELDCIYLSLLDRLLKEWKKRGFRGEHRLHYVLTESLINAYKHGNKGDKNKPIYVRWRWGNDLHYEVIDEGEGFDYKNLPDPTLPENLEHSRGRGIFIIRHFANHISWRDSGRHFKAVFEKHSEQNEGKMLRVLRNI